VRTTRRLQAALCVAAVGAALYSATGVAVAAPGVTPATVDLNLAPGASTTITKTVTTPAIPPKPDIVFLIDTTGSMGGVIANVQANANTILNDVADAQPDAQFAVAEYRDAGDTPPFEVQQNMTGNQTAVTNGLNALVAGGGGDAPEDGINGLFQVATGAVAFRPGSARIVLLIGDAPSHDPSLGHSLGSAISALQAADITVLALDLAALDATGQATAITNATGGQLFSGINPSQVSATILAALHNLPVTITHQLSGCDPNLTVGLTPASRTVTSGDDGTFTETVTVAPGAVPGTTLACSVNFLLNGTLSPGFTETITEHVPKVTPTITTTPSGPVPAGGSISDSATLTGGFAPMTGTVTFLLFGPGDTTCATPIATRTGTVSGGGASSGSVPSGGAGTYRWVATYSGDSHNNAATSPCGAELVTVTKATPAIATTPSGSVPAGGNVSDSATVSGGFSPTGTVTFQLFGPGDTTCATPIATRTGTLAGGSASSGGVPSGAAGTYNWVATYNGDANNGTVVSPCGSEQVVVTKAIPNIATVPSGSVPAGGSVSDTANVTGGFSPTGTVTFLLFAPGDTTCTTPIATRTGTLSGGTTGSGAVTIGAAGTYRWVATYNGDANNSSVVSFCGDEQVVVVKATPTIATTPSGSVPAGGAVSDSAAVSGGFNPTGTVTFQLFAPGDTSCTTAIATRTGALVGGTAASGPVTSGGVGTYRWVATYGGDANNNAATSPCGAELVVVTKATPAIATTPSGSVPAGGDVSDSATVSGGFTPTGTVTFQLFAPGDTTCASPIATRTGALAGSVAGSGNVTIGAAGTYRWVGTYNGDANNNPVTSPCGDEQVVVVKATPGIGTTPSGTVPAGGTISDSAAVTGGFTPTGTVTFQLFGPGDTACATPIATRTGTLSGGTAASGNVAAGGVGTYRWVATYNGDGNNNAVVSPCGAEQVIVIKASPNIATTPSGTAPAGGNVSDSATVSGGFTPTGSVTFQLFGPGDITCTTPIATRTGALSGGTAGSGNVAAGGVGVYNWVATYTGDANNNPATSPCGDEQVTVIKASPGITTTPSGTVPAGGNTSDTAHVTGGFNPTGTVTFRLYAPGDTTCATAIATRTGTLSGGTAASGPVPVGAAGTYNWVATYSGDANNNPVTGPCGSEPVVVTPQRLTGRAFGLTAQASLLGIVLVNVPPIPDTGHVSTTATTTTSVPCVATVGGLVSAHALCAQVATTAFPGRSVASASVDDTTVGITGIPVVSLAAIQSTSTTTCAGSAGTTTIAFLKVGNTVVISQPTAIAPNTTINLGVVKLVLNEQIPFSTPDAGLTVNAVHLTVNTLGLALTNVVIASSESDIGNCP
jgi:hypothetical protein